jgi:hypothetical protein
VKEMVRNLKHYSTEFKKESVSVAISYGNVNQAAKNWVLLSQHYILG